MHARAALALFALSVSLLPLGGTSLRAQDESPMRWRSFEAAPKARPAPRAQPTYRARRRYERPRATPAVQVPVPETLPDGTPNPDYKPGAMMPAPAEAGAAPAPGTAPQPAVPMEKRPVIALLGDSLAEALAFGLEADAAFKGEFALRQKTVSASGLVRDDFHDWPKTLAALVKDTPPPAALVVMVGLNDRQVLRVGGAAHEPLSEPWRAAYGARIDAMIAAARGAKVPLIWVGLPAMRAAPLSGDLAQINAMIRERVEAAGESFVEIYDGFADATGGFSATGPDIIGDTVRLRGPDGIHFTPAGQRKLAFFVGKPLRKRLETVALPASLPTEPPPAPRGEVSTPLPAQPAARAPTQAAPQIPARIRPEIGETRPLGTPPTATALTGAPPPHQDPATEALFGQGLSPAPRAGRADDFRWK